ncbi:Predicted DNA binding protein, contains HTH domain [Haladaptatus litoreus]|uniref:Predicted DNA binding protein, contains HTH domain n=1 Tax=Haladaptatus litoreus TaxID=553468 RepID=A0A1N7F971_9EURY|nr:helix-turn-helix domain-containing protein [Haladaptatus litoreus]SIR96887.1 Predicted DNA binding protein, contains HTH domain [Haladaptatus litoreus]
MQSIDLTVDLPESMQLPIPESLSTDAFVREELLTWQVREETDVVCFLSLVVGEIETIRTTVASLDVVQQTDFTMVDENTFYLYAEMDLRPSDYALWAALDHHGIVPVPPIVYTDTGTIQVTILGEEDALSRAVSSFPNEVDIDVTRVGEHQHLIGSLAGRLTYRQFEAITIAHELGYYRVPRETSLADVAAALDCSESSASTLLRKGEQSLVNAALGH